MPKEKYLKYVDADDLINENGLEIMVSSMEKYPEASFGMSSKFYCKNKDYLFLTSRSSFINHYFKYPVFIMSPLSSIIRRDCFIEVGGFSGKQHVGDFELWLKLASLYPIVLFPYNLTWYRIHDEQQMNDNRKNPMVNFKYTFIEEQKINQLNFLTKREKIIILLKIRKRQLRQIYKNGIFTKISLNMIRYILFPSAQIFFSKKS